MDPQDALTTVAEIAIAIAGFSGIAAVLGRRRVGEWAPADVFRLRLLLRISFAVVLFCFLPIVLSSASVAPKLTWAVSSGAWLAYFCTDLAFGIRSARRMANLADEPIERRYAALMGSLAVGIITIHALNVTLIREVWPYLAGLVATLMVPFTQFIRLLRGVLRSADERALG